MFVLFSFITRVLHNYQIYFVNLFTAFTENLFAMSVKLTSTAKALYQLKGEKCP